jgi:hypothetical protein
MILALFLAVTLDSSKIDTVREIDYIAPIERWIDSSESTDDQEWKSGGTGIIERSHLRVKDPTDGGTFPTLFDSPWKRRDWC